MKKETLNSKKPSVKELMDRLVEAEETIDAIKHNKVDALLITTNSGEQVYILKDAERFYKVIVDKMNEGAITLSSEGTIDYINNKFAGLLKLPPSTVISSSIYKWISIEDLTRFTDFLHRNEEDSGIEINFLGGDGQLTPAFVSITHLQYEGTAPVTCLIAADLTLRKKTEEISAAENLARSVIEQTSEAIIVCDKDLKIIRASRGAEKVAGVKLLNEHFDSVFELTNTNSRKLELSSIIENQLPYQEDVVFRNNDGNYFNFIFNINTLIGSSDVIIGYIITMANITAHVNAEKIITASLNEKTLLLKEIHHRIKNNLQIISSLLNIQASYIKEQSLQNVFLDCQQRIASMALIHQKLYESKSFSHINIADYLEDMTAFLCSTYLFNSNRISFNFSVKDVQFSIESAVPIGLIMNELITNCFKHAFKDKSEAHLIISLYMENENILCISVKDNGVGFPNGFEIDKTDSLGLQLVHTLVDQVDGRISMVSEGGSEFKLLVPIA